MLRERGALFVEEAMETFLQIARGLVAAHQRGIVYQNIKHQNILIAPDGTAKVTDFGIPGRRTSRP